MKFSYMSENPEQGQLATFSRFLCNILHSACIARFLQVSKSPFLCVTDLTLLLDLFCKIKFYVAHLIINRRVEAQRYTTNPGE